MIKKNKKHIINIRFACSGNYKKIIHTKDTFPKSYVKIQQIYKNK